MRTNEPEITYSLSTQMLLQKTDSSSAEWVIWLQGKSVAACAPSETTISLPKCLFGSQSPNPGLISTKRDFRITSNVTSFGKSTYESGAEAPVAKIQEDACSFTEYSYSCIPHNGQKFGECEKFDFRQEFHIIIYRKKKTCIKIFSVKKWQ